ncbi:UNVERIFIED_CONTAM: hypothetical protein K2H54_049849 [Gekko kuhli]
MARGAAASPASPPSLLLLLWSGAVYLACCGSPPASAPPPVPCQAPVQWEGRTVRYDHNTGKNTRALVSYDGPNQRLRVLEERKGLIPCKKSDNLAGKPFVSRQLEQFGALGNEVLCT